MRTEHAIFNQPIKVALTLEDQPTPKSYARYKEGRDLGESMSMWRVQTEGYLSHEGQLIGVVSRDAGFFDSPDVEWVSGGVNSKGPMAVALGRHGNFFHWGFAASPTYMTKEAKDVFFNAIHHISRFDGQTPIARKVRGVMIRSYIEDVIQSMTEDGYAKTVETYDRLRADDQKRKEEIQKRIDDGEDVSEMDQRIVKMSPVKTPGRIDRARRLVSDEKIEELEEDPDKLSQYLLEIKPYVIPDGYFKLKVDEQLMPLGIANNDLAMLDRAIELLQTSENPWLGQVLLHRYTQQSFKSADQWKSWLKQNRDKLFFTEAGGYKWLVNERVAKRAAAKAIAPTTAKASSDSPFAAAVSIKENGDNEFVLQVNIDIHEGWHAYDVVPDNSAYLPVELKLDLPEGVKQSGKWQRPPSTPSIDDPGLTTFVGNATFSCRLVADKSTNGEITCSISYQVCDDKQCLPPTTDEYQVKLK